MTMGVKRTQKDIIEQFRKVHGRKYSYKNFVYTLYMNKSIVTCRKHGDFLITPDKHIHGRGCALCHDDNISKDTTFFVKMAKKVHGNTYDYSKSVYTKRNAKITIICKHHGDFQQIAHNHLLGNGCAECFFSYKVCRFGRKQVNIGSRTLSLQGYEPFAIDYMIRHKKVKGSSIFSGKDVPTIYYEDPVRRKQRRHYPDFFIKNQNRLVEVKSDWTFRIGLDTLIAKRSAAIAAGYKYSVLVFDKTGNRINVSKKWYKRKTQCT